MKTNQRTGGVAVFLFAVGLAFLPGAVVAQVTGDTGGGQPFSTMQPSLAMNYLISLSGIFPAPDGGVPAGKYVGEVVPFAGNFAPGGWALADGQLIPINQNTALFSILGTTYGGDGITDFALPDLRGRSVIGAGQGPGLTNRNLGETTGVAQMSLTDAEMPAHTHTLPGGGVTGSEGGNQPYTNMKPSLAMNFSVSLQGIFPSQGGGGTTSSPFVGEVNLFAGNFSFADAPAASGQLLPINQNPVAFDLLGTTYGGDGINTFALPDLQGRTPIGAGQGPGLMNRNLGDEPGHEQTTLTVGQLPAHFHTLPGGGVTGVTGNNQPIDNMEPSTTLNYIIAVNGIFPSQGGSGLTVQPMIGEIGLFAGEFAPTGWMLADGQLIPINQNTALFSILGTTYGGDGISDFALPDLRGRTIIGAGQGLGLPDYTLGETTGVDPFFLTVPEMSDHDHPIPAPNPPRSSSSVSAP